MIASRKFLIESTSNYEAWVTGLQSLGYSSFESDVFEVSVRRSDMWGISAVDVAFASRRVSRAERTHRQTRVDGRDYYKAVFQISGRSTVIQNDCVMEIAAGEFALVDMAQSSSLITNSSRWLAMYMPRRSLRSHLGMEPRGGTCWHNAAPVSRVLFRLVSDTLAEIDEPFCAGEPYMELAIYDLFGALLRVSDASPSRSPSDKLFMRVCSIAKGRFSEPGISYLDVANEAGISLRYLQKLFTTRGTTCGRFIQSLRLDQAARLLRRRKLIKSDQPLSEIAHACGFRDYGHFCRTFRRRFGCSPTAASDGHLAGDEWPREAGRRIEIA